MAFIEKVSLLGSVMTCKNGDFETLCIPFIFSAVDLDEGLAGKLTYTVSDSDGKGYSGSGSLFGVFPDGRVYLQDHLDRETQAYHSLTVTAHDGDTVSPRSSSASVVVYVTDVNDNSPRYISSSPFEKSS